MVKCSCTINESLSSKAIGTSAAVIVGWGPTCKIAIVVLALLANDRVERLLEMLAIVVADVIGHPLKGYTPIGTVIAFSLPGIVRQVGQVRNEPLAQLRELGERIFRVLSAIVALNLPERVIVCLKTREISRYNRNRAVEVNHFPIAKMRKNLYDSPTPVRRRPHENISITLPQ